MEAERTLIFFVAATLVLLSSCLAKTTVVHAGAANVGEVVINSTAQPQVVYGSGRQGLTARSLPHFERVVIGVAATVRVSQGEAPSATLRGDDNLLSSVETRMQAGVLYLESKESLAPRLPLVIELTTPALVRLEQRASGNVELEGMRGTQLSLVLAGAGRLQGSGNVDNLELDLTGSGEMRMGELRSGAAVVRIGGAGNIQVNAERFLRATITGAGKVTYRGEPRIEQEIRGAGSVLAENS